MHDSATLDALIHDAVVAVHAFLYKSFDNEPPLSNLFFSKEYTRIALLWSSTEAGARAAEIIRRNESVWDALQKMANGKKLTLDEFEALKTHAQKFIQKTPEEDPRWVRRGNTDTYQHPGPRRLAEPIPTHEDYDRIRAEALKQSNVAPALTALLDYLGAHPNITAIEFNAALRFAHRRANLPEPGSDRPI